MQVTLPNLPYAFDALEPHYEARTLEIHYSKHHQAYTDKLNAALEQANLPETTIEALLANLDSVPEQFRTAIRNHGGGYLNHTFFWESMQPNPSGEARMPIGKLAQVIDAKFGSFDKFKEEFGAKAGGHFGSGWAWLVVNQAGELEITDTHDQVSPISLGHKPILTIDVWEHAYYLQFQNRRPEWTASFFNIINWERAEERFNA